VCFQIWKKEWKIVLLIITLSLSARSIQRLFEPIWLHIYIFRYAAWYQRPFFSNTVHNFSTHIPRKIKVVSLDWTRPKDPPLSLGHASIIANLKAHQIDVSERSWSVNSPEFQTHEVLDFVFTSVDSNTDVAFGAFVWNEKYLQEILKKIKAKKFPGRVILGGPQISYVKTNIESFYPEADIFIRGYAKDVLSQLLLSSDPFPSIRGIHYAGQPSLNLSALSDLNQLPSPFLTDILSKQRFLRWETQRGCPFRCSFCQHRESDPTQKRRAFPPARLQKEIKWLTEDNIVQDLAILDPTFNSGDQYLQVLEQFARLQYRGKLALQCRMEMVKPEFLDLIEAINQTGQVVLEFGLQTVHKAEQQIIQRPNNLRRVAAVVEDLHKRNIESEISLIFGLPGQTLQSFQESVSFCQDQLCIPTIHAFPLMLLRGTPLYEQKQQLQLVESSDVHFDQIPRVQQDIPHVISSPSFSFQDWLRMGEIAEALETRNLNHGKTTSG
jgi:radical SAM superfamily enzyme